MQLFFQLYFTFMRAYIFCILIYYYFPFFLHVLWPWYDSQESHAHIRIMQVHSYVFLLVDPCEDIPAESSCKP